MLAPSVVNAHIVDGRYPAASLRLGQVLRSRSGGSIEVVSSGNEPVVLRAGPGGFSVGATPGDARITEADIPCTSGVIHKIDHLLVR
ncbi:fasciclin domain-containing protein [Siccirubricoccus deserti]